MQVLLEMYETATGDEPHSWWYVDLMANKKEDMMLIRFEHKMVLNRNDTTDALDPARLEDGGVLNV